MARTFLGAGALIFVALGSYHLVFTLRDLWGPRTFTPSDENLRFAMMKSRLALSPAVNLWDAWMGFNLSHSLGLILFGGGLLTIAWAHFPAFAQSPSLQFVAITVAVVYLALSLRFWFWGPAVGTGIGLACFLVAAVSLRAL